MIILVTVKINKLTNMLVLRFSEDVIELMCTYTGQIPNIVSDRAYSEKIVSRLVQIS